MERRTHSREFKLRIVQQLASGEKRFAQVCREHKLAASVVARWRTEYQERGLDAFREREAAPIQSDEERIAELERLCGQLALENSVLKKALKHATSRSGTR